MRTFRTTVSFFAFSLILSACAGADGDAMPVEQTNDRCTEQGMCLHLVGKKSLQGAFRSGTDEIKFDILHRPYYGFSVGGVYPWCMRLVDHKSREFYFHDNGHCPRSWYEKKGLKEPLERGQDPDFDRRDQLANSLYATLQITQSPRSREQAFKELKESVELHMEGLEAAAKLTADSRARASATKGDTAQQAKEEEILRSAVRMSMEQEGSEDAEDEGLIAEEPQESTKKSSDEPDEISRIYEAKTHNDEEVEEPDEDEWPLKRPEEIGDTKTEASLNQRGRILSQQGRPVSLFSRGSSDGVPKISPEEVISNPDFEYKQDITLFSKQVKRNLLGGRKTRKHHTAARIKVFARKRGSQDNWKMIDEEDTANHGSSPRSREMKEYNHCTDTPVTYGRTVWKGECNGNWGILRNQHLCNDDTRLQIRNAYNIASNKNCEHVDHYHRPWCATR